MLFKTGSAVICVQLTMIYMYVHKQYIKIDYWLSEFLATPSHYRIRTPQNSIMDWALVEIKHLKEIFSYSGNMANLVH